MAEVVSGKSWAQLVDETYVEPCGATLLGHFNKFQDNGTTYPEDFQQDPNNMVGLALLAVVVGMAVLSLPTPFQRYTDAPTLRLPFHVPFVWLPGFIVPIALLAHLLSLRKWFRQTRRPPQRSSPRGRPRALTAAEHAPPPLLQATTPRRTTRSDPHLHWRPLAPCPQMGTAYTRAAQSGTPARPQL